MVQADAEGIEFDLQLSKDSVPMVYHDPHLKRMTSVDKLVSDLTANELKALKVRSKSSDNSGTIPTLDEALEIIIGKKQLYIELKKGDSNKIAESVLSVIDNRLSEDSFTLSSFDPDLIKAVKTRK